MTGIIYFSKISNQVKKNTGEKQMGTLFTQKKKKTY